MWSTAREIAAGDVVIVWLVADSYLICLKPPSDRAYAYRRGIFFSLWLSLQAKNSTVNLAVTDTVISSGCHSDLRLGLATEKASSTFFVPPLSCGLWRYHTARRFFTSPISHISHPGSTLSAVALSLKPVCIFQIEFISATFISYI